MDKLVKTLKGYAQDRESYSSMFAYSEINENDMVIYVDNKHEKVLKFEDDLDSDKENF
jgi:hypothetical protein